MKKEEKPVEKSKEPQVLYVNLHAGGVDYFAYETYEEARANAPKGVITKKFVEALGGQ